MKVFRQSRGRDAREHACLPLDHDDVRSEQARRRSDFEPDKAGADDGDARTGMERGLQSVGIANGAQLEDARKIVTWHGQ